MKISTRGRYALRLMLDIAVNSATRPVSIKDIAKRQDISDKYLEQIISILNSAHFVRSVRGAGGGYVLVKRLEDISVGDVLRALEGSLEPVDCAGLEPNGGCSVSDSCVTKYVWKKINDSINQTVDEIKLDQLVKENGKNCRN